MAKPSSKKVSRAARTTGGRTARGATPWGFYSVMALIIVLGAFLVFQSREERQEAFGNRADIPPTKADHWHAALGIYVCDKFLPPLADNGRDPHGIHTHGDGVIHIHPFDSQASGNNAVLGEYAETMNFKLSATQFSVPGGETWNDGERCDGKRGEVQFFVNGQRRSGDPSSYKFNDRDLLVLAFAPRDAEIPKTPPSAPNLDNLSDMPGATTTVPPGEPGTENTETTDTTAAGEPGAETSDTTAPPPTDTTATSAP